MDEYLKILQSEVKQRPDLADLVQTLLSQSPSAHFDHEILDILVHFPESSTTLPILQLLLANRLLKDDHVHVFVQVARLSVEKSPQHHLKAIQLLSQTFTADYSKVLDDMEALSNAVFVLTVPENASSVLCQAAESGFRHLLGVLLRSSGPGAVFLKDVALDVPVWFQDMRLGESLRVDLWTQAISSADAQFWTEANLDGVITDAVIPLALEDDDSKRFKLLTVLIEKAETLKITDAIKRLVIPALLSRRTHLEILENTICKECTQFIDSDLLESLKLLVVDEKLTGSVSNLSLACLSAAVKDASQIADLWPHFLDLLLLAYSTAKLQNNANVILSVLRGLDALFTACLPLEEGAQPTADSVAKIAREEECGSLMPARKTFLNMLHRGLAQSSRGFSVTVWNVWLDTVQLIDYDACSADDTVIKVAVDTLFTAVPCAEAALLLAKTLVLGSGRQSLSSWRLAKLVMLLETSAGMQIGLPDLASITWPLDSVDAVIKLITIRPGQDASSIIAAIDLSAISQDDLETIFLSTLIVPNLPTAAKILIADLAMKRLQETALLKVADALVDSASLTDPLPLAIFCLLANVAESGALNAALRAISVARKACDSATVIASPDGKTDENELVNFFNRLCLMRGQNSQSHQIRDCAISTLFAVVQSGRGTAPLVSSRACIAIAEHVIRHVPDEQEEQDSKASDLIVHHTRDSAEKQWQASRLIVVNNLDILDRDETLAELLSVALLAWFRGGLVVRRALAKMLGSLKNLNSVGAWITRHSSDLEGEDSEVLFVELAKASKLRSEDISDLEHSLIPLGLKILRELNVNLKSVEVSSDPDTQFLFLPLLATSASVDKLNAVTELCLLSTKALEAALELFLSGDTVISEGALARVLCARQLSFSTREYEDRVVSKLCQVISPKSEFPHPLQILAVQALLFLVESSGASGDLIVQVQPIICAWLQTAEESACTAQSLLRLAVVRLSARFGLDISEFLTRPSPSLVQACLDVRLKNADMHEPVVVWVKKNFITSPTLAARDLSWPPNSESHQPDSLVSAIVELVDTPDLLDVLANSWRDCGDVEEARSLSCRLLPVLASRIEDDKLKRAIQALLSLLTKNSGSR